MLDVNRRYKMMLMLGHIEAGRNNQKAMLGLQYLLRKAQNIFCINKPDTSLMEHNEVTEL